MHAQQSIAQYESYVQGARLNIHFITCHVEGPVAASLESITGWRSLAHLSRRDHQALKQQQCWKRKRMRLLKSKLKIA